MGNPEIGFKTILGPGETVSSVDKTLVAEA